MPSARARKRSARPCISNCTRERGEGRTSCCELSRASYKPGRLSMCRSKQPEGSSPKQLNQLGKNQSCEKSCWALHGFPAKLMPRSSQTPTEKFSHWSLTWQSGTRHAWTAEPGQHDEKLHRRLQLAYIECPLYLAQAGRTQGAQTRPTDHLLPGNGALMCTRQR